MPGENVVPEAPPSELCSIRSPYRLGARLESAQRCMSSLSRSAATYVIEAQAVAASAASSSSSINRSASKCQ